MRIIGVSNCIRDWGAGGAFHLDQSHSRQLRYGGMSWKCESIIAPATWAWPAKRKVINTATWVCGIPLIVICDPTLLQPQKPKRTNSNSPHDGSSSGFELLLASQRRHFCRRQGMKRCVSVFSSLMISPSEVYPPYPNPKAVAQAKHSRDGIPGGAVPLDSPAHKAQLGEDAPHRSTLRALTMLKHNLKPSENTPEPSPARISPTQRKRSAQSSCLKNWQLTSTKTSSCESLATSIISI